jgi:hypothetical protein
MARWRQGTQSLAALVMLGILPAGCDAVDATNGQMSAADRTAAFFALLDIADGGDPATALERRGARLDRTYEKVGQLLFEVPALAGKGSELILAKGKPGQAEAIALTPAAPIRLSARDVAARFGEGRRLPALPGQGWRIEYRGEPGRTIATYSASPDLPTSILVRIERRSN